MKIVILTITHTLAVVLGSFLATDPASAQVGEAKKAPHLPQRQIVPLDVKRSAQAALQKVMDKTVRGDNQAAIDSMNPEYLEIISRANGGVVKHKAKLLNALNMMGKNGVTIQAGIAQVADSAMECDYGLVEGPEGVKMGVYRKWMVFVPTVKDISILDNEQQPPVLRTFRKWDFEVAISPKGREDWTFINGGGINSLELRKLFPFLPKEDKAFFFPEIKTEELTKKK